MNLWNTGIRQMYQNALTAANLRLENMRRKRDEIAERVSVDNDAGRMAFWEKIVNGVEDTLETLLEFLDKDIPPRHPLFPS